MPKVADHKDEKKWSGISIRALSVPSTLRLLALLLWRRGHTELSLRGEGTGGEGGRLYKLCPGYSLAQMEIHKGQGGGIGAWKCIYEEKEQERLLTFYSSCWAGPASVALG